MINWRQVLTLFWTAVATGVLGGLLLTRGLGSEISLGVSAFLLSSFVCGVILIIGMSSDIWEGMIKNE